jgi:ferredoxin
VKVTLRVDPIACDAFGYCAELVPELITLDEWGYPIIEEREIPADLMPVVRNAVASCPRKALEITRNPRSPR